MKTLKMTYTDPRNKLFSAKADDSLRVAGFEKDTIVPSMLLCRDAINEMLTLPEDVHEIVLVPLKRATADTVKIKKAYVNGGAGLKRASVFSMYADGKRYIMNIYMCKKFHQWIDAGYSNVRVEY